MSTSIQPTVGRSLYFFPTMAAVALNQPCIALLCGVNGDGTINIRSFDKQGNDLGAFTGVHLRQPGDDVVTHPHAEWMPFQAGQAAKAKAEEQEDGDTANIPAEAPVAEAPAPTSL